jgi:hypothetical protein
MDLELFSVKLREAAEFRHYSLVVFYQSSINVLSNTSQHDTFVTTVCYFERIFDVLIICVDRDLCL